ncbi:MAG: cation:proton antiporter, partial [Candidatus Woesearchaeota archaeon]
MHDVLIIIAIIIIIATIFAYLARLLNQPIIPAYIIAGILIGPLGLKQTLDLNFVFSVSEIAIAFLLFIVGLELSYKRFKTVGKSATVVGATHILILAVIGYIAALLFGFIRIEALYIGLALAFSSTMVVLKLLSDSEELKSLHGRLMIGILLIEDIVIIIILMILKNLNTLSIELMFLSVFKLAAFLLFAILFAKYILPFVFESVAKHQDFLFLGSLAWLFLAILVSHFIDFSIAIGAFIAGISLASTPYNIEIIGKIKHLKDFFIAI